MEEQNQNRNDELDCSFTEQPYVSRGIVSEEEAVGLHSTAAVRSFLVVFVGLFITTVSAYAVLFSNMGFYGLVTSGAFMFFLIAEVVVVILNGIAINKKQLALAGVLYIAYAIINGVTLSVVFYAYQVNSIKEAFLLATLTFGVMAAYGYFTKKDLAQVGSICTMALLGVLLVSAANIIFFHSSGLDLLMDYVVVLLFVGITAFDMNKMKKMVELGGEEEINRVALYTGMQLYLDFINLFLRILRIMGKKR